MPKNWTLDFVLRPLLPFVVFVYATEEVHVERDRAAHVSHRLDHQQVVDRFANQA